MRILLDQCIPRSLKRHLIGYECWTVPEAGWSGKKNGELLSFAEREYDVFLTLDKGVEYQLNLSNRNIAIVIVRAVSNRIEDLIEHVPACLGVFDSVQSGQVLRVPLG
jgi:predicted nuclease of predicted toxin-antitoxin system